MRFTIRDLIWLTVVTAVVVSWRMDRHKLAAELDSPSLNTADLSGLPGTITPSDIVVLRPRQVLNPGVPARNLPGE